MKNTIKIEVLISTMHQENYSLLNKINIKCDAVVVNQCNNNKEETFLFNGYNVKWINTTERGLSKSRNKAISYSTADVCLIVDEDEELYGDYVETITNSFTIYSEAKIIAFQVRGIEKKFKSYSQKEQKIGYIKSMKLSSVEIAFRRKDFIHHNIQFDELIGAGTKYLMGEENALLFQCLRKNFKIRYVPKIIAAIHIGKSTWFSGFNREYMIGRGAAFTAMSTKYAIVLILQFAIRKKKYFINNISIKNAIRYMMIGRKEYLNDIKKINI